MDKISDALGTATEVATLDRDKKQLVTPAQLKAIALDTQKAVKENLQNDYLDARSNLKEIIDESMELIPEMMNLIKSAESARMYEAGSSFIKTLVDMNKDLIKLSSDIVSTEKKEPPPSGEITNPEDNSWEGSSDDLFKMISKRRSKSQPGQELDVNNSVGVKTIESAPTGSDELE